MWSFPYVNVRLPGTSLLEIVVHVELMRCMKILHVTHARVSVSFIFGED